MVIIKNWQSSYYSLSYGDTLPNDHVAAVEKVAQQHIATKYCKCNSLRVISHIIILGKTAVTHSKVGQSSPNQKNFEERKNSLGQVIYQKCATVIVSEKTA